MKPGDLVSFKEGIVLDHAKKSAMLVVETFVRRKDEGRYIKVVREGVSCVYHSSQLVVIRKKGSNENKN